MRERRRALSRLAIATIAAVAVASSSAATVDGCDPSPRPANLAFTLKDVNGRAVSLAAFAGRVVLINFWATWCAPCKVEIPGLVQLSTEYERLGLTVLGVSIDDTPSRLSPFIAQFGMTYPVLVGRDHERLQDVFGPRAGVPRSFLIGRDGTICKRYIGLVEKAVVERQIRSLL